MLGYFTPPLHVNVWLINPRCFFRSWAKKRHIKSTHYLLGDSDSSLYRHVVPGHILANRRRLPNAKLKPREYRIGATSNGLYRLLTPYPPNANPTLEPYPKNVAGIQNDAHKMGHYKYIQKYKGVDHHVLKRLVPYPRGTQSAGIASRMHESAERLTCRFLNIRKLETCEKSETRHGRDSKWEFEDYPYKDIHEKANGLEKKFDTSVLQHLNQHLPSFKVDQLITVGVQLARICSDYGTWVKTNTREFQAVVSTCHLCLVTAIPHLDAKQLYTTFIISKDIKRRYNALEIDADAIIKRQSQLAQEVPIAKGNVSVEFPSTIVQTQQQQSGNFKQVYRRFIERYQRLYIQKGDAVKHCAALLNMSIELLNKDYMFQQHQTKANLNVVKTMVKHELCPLEQVVRGCLTLLKFDHQHLNVLEILYQKIGAVTLDLYMPMDEHLEEPLTDFALKCTALVLDGTSGEVLVELIDALDKRKLVDQHSAALVVPMLIDVLDRNRVESADAYKCMKILLSPFTEECSAAEYAKDLSANKTMRDDNTAAEDIIVTQDPWGLLYDNVYNSLQLPVTSLHVEDQSMELNQVYPFNKLAPNTNGTNTTDDKR